MAEQFLYECLRSYVSGDSYPLHMPGHKRQMMPLTGSPYSLDITEIDGFDNLNDPSGILQAAQERAARLYGAGATFFLTGGSTAGILSGVSAGLYALKRAGNQEIRLLMARNCHKSVYHAAILNRLETVYLKPQPFTPADPEGEVPAAALRSLNGRIAPETVRAAMESDRAARLVVITSPTYEGLVSDIRAIAEIVHEHGGLLIVDEAHGAHFGFHPAFPRSAVTLGADLVVQSLHKTLPALTQSALLHVCSDRVDPALVQRVLSMYATSSPSYVLMAGMDECIRLMADQGETLLDSLWYNLKWFYERCSFLRSLTCIRTDDPSKILITDRSGKWSGNRISGWLREEARMETEMSAPGYALALMSLADTREGFGRLMRALEEMDRMIADPAAGADPDESGAPGGDPGENGAAGADPGESGAPGNFPGENRLSGEAWQETAKPTIVMPMYKTMEKPAQRLPLFKSSGRVSAGFINLYPPGIPLIAPGERITDALIRRILGWRRENFQVQGLDGDDTVAVVMEET